MIKRSWVRIPPVVGFFSLPYSWVEGEPGTLFWFFDQFAVLKFTRLLVFPVRRINPWLELNVFRNWFSCWFNLNFISLVIWVKVQTTVAGSLPNDNIRQDLEVSVTHKHTNTHAHAHTHTYKHINTQTHFSLCHTHTKQTLSHSESLIHSHVPLTVLSLPVSSSLCHSRSLT